MNHPPLRLKRRADLQIQAHEYRGVRLWAVKDPLALNYFHLRDEEHFLLQQLDGRSSVADIRDGFNARFAPQFVTSDQIVTFCSQMHAQGLVLAEQHDQAQVLRNRQRRTWGQGLLQAAANPLAVRLPGADVSLLIESTYPALRWAFRPTGLILACLLGLAAGVLLLSHGGELTSRLPQLHEYLRGTHLVLLMVTLFGIKLVHELGHAAACRHYGGECREVGIMLLVLTPCLYCNVSDAWMLPNKWQRMVVSAAGIYMELILAAAAGILWFFSEPGLANSLFLNILLICTLGTVFLNGNPLLRYDGYFVLADLVEIPNLAAEAQRAMVAPWKSWFCRMPTAADLPTAGPRWFLLSYGWLALVYRIVMVTVICWTVYRLFEAWELTFVGAGLVGTVVAGTTAPWWMGVWRMATRPDRMQLRPLRTRAALALAAVVLLAFIFWPLRGSVRAPVHFQSANARPVIAGASGRCVWSRAYGERVQAGELLVRLVDPATERELVRLAGRVAELQQLLITRRHQAHLDDRFLAQLPTTEVELRSVKDQWAALRQNAEQLEIRAPCDGVLLPPPVIPEAPDIERQLGFWTGTPLQPQNAGLFVRRGETVGVVGEVREMQALAIVDQEHVERILPAAPVRLLPLQAGGGVRRAKVTLISSSPVDAIPPSVALLGGIALQGETLTPVTPHYHLALSLESSDTALRHGAAGWARLAAQPETLAARMVRVLQTLFHFHL